MEELVVQPLLVSLSALTLATETVRSILKIDDVVSSVYIMFSWIFFHKHQDSYCHLICCASKYNYCVVVSVYMLLRLLRLLISAIGTK